MGNAGLSAVTALVAERHLSRAARARGGPEATTHAAWAHLATEVARPEGSVRLVEELA